MPKSTKLASNRTPLAQPGPTPELHANFWADLKMAWRARKSRKKNSALATDHHTSISLRQVDLQRALQPGFDSLGIWFALFLISASALAAGVEFGGRFGLVIGFGVTLILNIWILFISPNQLEARFCHWQLEGRDAWGLLQAAKEAATRAGIACPKVALADSDAYFSLSYGMSPSRSTIVLSHALVEKLSAEERRLVIAFEVAKIACQWTASATVARGLCLLIDWPGLGILTNFILRFSIGNIGNVGVSGLGDSSNRILKLDEWVASLAESREVWARTLWSLDAMVCSKPRRSKLSDCALDTVSAKKTKFDRVLPSVQTRISALIDRYPP